MAIGLHRKRSSARLVVVGLLIGAFPGPGTARAQTTPSVSYDVTAQRSLVQVEKFLRTTQTLERIHRAAALAKLPSELRYRARTCGRPDVWYAPEERRVTLCYEYVRALWRELRPHAEWAPDDLRPLQAFVDLTLLHETAHAFFDLLNVPVLGREEDAADQVAAMILLQLSKPEAVRKLRQVVGLMRVSAGMGKLTVEDVADDHSLTAQRLYNIVCLAYGQDHRSYRRLALETHMPLWRRRACRSEYRQVKKAMRALIQPHIIDKDNVFSAIRAIYREEKSATLR